LVATNPDAKGVVAIMLYKPCGHNGLRSWKAERDWMGGFFHKRHCQIGRKRFE
jgi:hypothetical protein